MGSLLPWLQANWQPVLLALIAVDQVLIGIFPQVPILGSIKGILQGLVGGGQNPPPAA